MADWVTGSVIHIKHWTENLFSLQLQAPVSTFQAGQFTKLALEIGGEKVQRAYSFVSAPHQEALEFYLVAAPLGLLSSRLQQLNAGDELLITKNATGFFTLDEIPNCETLWLLATGTGIGPYLSILQEGKDLQRFQHIVLVHAARFARDLSYLPLLQQLAQHYDGQLTVQTILSRETTTDALHGRIPTLLLDGSLEAAVGKEISPESSHIMLCGNPQMVRETQQFLNEHKQMQKHLRRKPGHITSEQYW